MIHITTAPLWQPEKCWLFDVIFRDRLATDYRITWSAESAGTTLNSPSGKKLTLTDDFFATTPEGSPVRGWALPPQALTVENPFRPGETLSGFYGSAYLHSGPDGWVCGLDLFASAFFMLSRWEEALPGARDRHGRCPAAAAAAHRFGWLEKPLVEEYADFIGRALELEPSGRRVFQVHFSCDVDHPLLWWSPGARVRTLAGETLRHGLPGLAWWLNRKSGTDPYNVFGDWLAMLEKYALTGHFNFMGARPREADAWYDLHHPFVRQTIQTLDSRGHQIGFHPSYEGWNDPERFVLECDSLEQLLGRPVRTGRQHYLRFSVPETWRVWAGAGMDWDSTAGYPEAPGFRCGTCAPFQVYDFVARQPLNLQEKPLIAMDITLALALGMTPEQGRSNLYALAESVRKYRGEMVILWHNSSWNTYFWAPWQPVLREFLEDFT